MARIRIVDEWLRSPVSAPSRHRAIVVVAESWSEQRVLMRAFAASDDQTRPTIHLHGAELAIGPAGADPHGQWGIHVQPPVDGRAQELRAQLELAAQRLAGARGRPPRLVDEAPAFEDKATHLWAPGTPPATPGRTVFGRPRSGYYEPAEVAPPSSSAVIPSAASSSRAVAERELRRTPPFWSDVSHARPRPAPRRNRARETAQGFAPPRPSQSFASLLPRTMPIGFALDDAERAVLNALGDADALSASQIEALIGGGDPVAWMEALTIKLSRCGLDLIAPGDDRDGEPTYLLRR